MPGGKGNIRHEDGNRFSSTNQPTNAGRKPKIFSALLKEMKARGIEPASQENIRDCFMFLLALPLTELVEIAGRDPASNNYPSIMRIAAKELLGKNAISILREMLDRSHGRAHQTVYFEEDNSHNKLEELSMEELLTMRSLLQKANIEDATIILE